MLESARELINVCEVVKFTPQFIYIYAKQLNKSCFGKSEWRKAEKN